MSDDKNGQPTPGAGYFNLEEFQRRKQLSREQDDADLRDGRVTAEDLRLRNGLFSGIDLSKATIRLRGAEKLRLKSQILTRVSEFSGGQQAVEWYRSAPIAALGGRTAEQIVEDGEGSSVIAYLHHKSLGGFE